MSPTLFFTVILLIGISFVFLAIKLKEIIKVLLILAGIIFVLFGGFGVFTAFL